MLVEEKQLDGGSIPGENREIHALLVDGSTEWMGSAGLRLEGSKGCCLPNICFPLRDGNGGWHGTVSGQDSGSDALITDCAETVLSTALKRTLHGSELFVRHLKYTLEELQIPRL